MSLGGVAGAEAATDRSRGRVQAALLTWLSGLGNSVVLAGVGFVSTPFLLRWLGDGPWGAWAVIGEWLGYLGLAQMSLGPGALAILLLRARHQGDAGGFVAVAKRGWVWYGRAALAATPVAAAVVWWGPRRLHPALAWAPALTWAVGLACLGGLVFAPAQLFRNVLDSAQRGFQVRWALLAQSLTITILSLGLAWRLRHGAWGLTGMAVAQCAGLAVGAGLWIYWCRDLLPGWRTRAAATIASRDLWALNWPLIVVVLGNQINVLTDGTVVAWRLGTAAVAPFVLTQTVPLMVGGQIADIGTSSWAGLGELRVQQPAAFRQRVVELATTVTGVSAVMVATAAAWDRDFVEQWVGRSHFGGGWLVAATAGAAVVFSVVCFFGWLLDTQGDSRRRMWVGTAGAVLNLGLSVAGTRRFGLAGVAGATLVAYLTTDAWYLPWLTVRQYGVDGRALARGICGALLRGGAWAATLALVVLALPTARSWVGLVARGVPTGIAALAYCWWVVLRRADRDAWRQRGRQWRANRT